MSPRINAPIDLMMVPYDSAHYGQRMGAGPLHLLEQGLVEKLLKRGHIIVQKQIDAEGVFNTEIATTFQLLHKIKSNVAAALDNKRFPLILSGNCNASVGTVAGYGAHPPGVIWFDAHGDCELPDTTTSGFLDGMAIAMLMRKCWHKKMAALTNVPLPPDHLILIGARDVSEHEKDFISSLQINYITVAQLRESTTFIDTCMNRLTEAGIRELHLHLDVDVFDPSIAPANAYSVPGGLSKEEVIDTIQYCTTKIPLQSAGIASYDPSYDVESRMHSAIYEVINTFTSLA